VVLEILTAVKDGDKEVLEHGKVFGVEEAYDLDEREEERLEAAIYHLCLVFLHFEAELVALILLRDACTHLVLIHAAICSKCRSLSLSADHAALNSWDLVIII